MQQCPVRLAAAEAARQRHDALDARFAWVEGAVDQVEERFAPEIGDAGPVGPGDPRTRRIPKPGGFGNVPQVFQRGDRQLRHHFTP